MQCTTIIHCLVTTAVLVHVYACREVSSLLKQLPPPPPAGGFRPGSDAAALRRSAGASQYQHQQLSQEQQEALLRAQLGTPKQQAARKRAIERCRAFNLVTTLTQMSMVGPML